MGSTSQYPLATSNVVNSAGGALLGQSPPITANQSGITTQVAITGASVTVTVAAGRSLRIHGECYFQNDTVNVVAGARLFIQQDGTQIQQCDRRLTGANVPEKFQADVIVSPAAGTHTYRLTCDNGGGGNLTMVAGATYPAYISVEDITFAGSSSPGGTTTPVGLLAQASSSTSPSGITTTDTSNGCSASITTPGGRNIKISVGVSAYSSVATDVMRVKVYKDGVSTWSAAYSAQPGGWGENFFQYWIDSPTAGMHTYAVYIVRDTGSGTLTFQAAQIYLEDVSPQPVVANTAPSSLLEQAQVTTAGQTLATTSAGTAISGLSLTVTVPAGRTLKLISDSYLQSTVAGDAAVLDIREGGTVLGQSQYSLPTANQAFRAIVHAIISPSAGTHTYQVYGWRNVGTGTVQQYANANAPSFFWIEDITATVWPTGSAVTSGLIASEAWTAYTPVWTASPTNPTLSNAVLNGRYIKLGRTVIGIIFFQYGSTSAAGSGTWQFSLPVAPAISISNWVVIGSGKGYAGGNSLNALARISNASSSLQLVYSATWPAGVETTVDPTHPWTWASGNTLDIQFQYEAAS
jgi:hypothetical protein